jgi:hypothetical protein
LRVHGPHLLSTPTSSPAIERLRSPTTRQPTIKYNTDTMASGSSAVGVLEGYAKVVDTCTPNVQNGGRVRQTGSHLNNFRHKVISRFSDVRTIAKQRRCYPRNLVRCGVHRSQSDWRPTLAAKPTRHRCYIVRLRAPPTSSRVQMLDAVSSSMMSAHFKLSSLSQMDARHHVRV